MSIMSCNGFYDDSLLSDFWISDVNDDSCVVFFLFVAYGIHAYWYSYKKTYDDGGRYECNGDTTIASLLSQNNYAAAFDSIKTPFTYSEIVGPDES